MGRFDRLIPGVVRMFADNDVCLVAMLSSDPDFTTFAPASGAQCSKSEGTVNGLGACHIALVDLHSWFY